MRHLLFVLGLALLPLAATAQRIDFCANYEADGTPIGEATEWRIGQDGSNLYILFRGQGKVTDGTALNFRLSSADGKVDTRIPMTYNAADGFLVVDFFFDVPGTYTATLTGAGGQPVATVTAVISQQASLTATTTASYKEARVGFAEQVTNGQAVGVAQVFGIGKDGGTIQVFLSSPTPFYTDALVVDVWKKEGSAFSQFVESISLTVEPEGRFVYFPYDFSEGGLYRFSFFTKGETFIQHGYIKTVVE